jgi:hypothetical protein
MTKYTFEYKQGRKKNFFLREHEGMFFLEKITKGCGFTLIAGTEEEITRYIDSNGFKLVGISRI